MKSRVRPNGAPLKLMWPPFVSAQLAQPKASIRLERSALKKLLGPALVTSAGIVGLSCEQQGEHLRR
jgi:hypothetical protein